MNLRTVALRLALLSAAALASAQPEGSASIFRHGNESAAHSKWDEALADYNQLAQAGVRSPSLYWNWAQVASAKGLKGEALWATLRARDLAPSDGTASREVERLRSELGLDPSEVSLGVIGEGRLLAHRFRLDVVAGLAFLIAAVATFGKKPRTRVAAVAFFVGALVLLPGIVGWVQDPRGVVVRKDASLVDAARPEGVTLSNLREGEVVPILAEEGDYFRIQDASGARGFAQKSDVRKIGTD